MDYSKYIRVKTKDFTSYSKVDLNITQNIYWVDGMLFASDTSGKPWVISES